MSSNPLFRVLRNGNEFNALIPKSKCEKVNFGQGDTQFSIQQIIKQVLQHSHQLKNVAELLIGNSFEQTCFNNHDFTYNHFQYLADGEAQMLRSPACAWKQRHEGLDCKSYSIIVSSLLQQQGIRHYIRKIKQPSHEPKLFTHVYVIVPVNQTTGALTNGYYTIDGTLPTMREPLFIAKEDFYMDKLRSSGLNGLNAESGFSFDSIGNYFNGPIDCWGGSAFTDEQAKNANNAAISLFASIIKDINLAVKTNNIVELSRLDNFFKGMMVVGYSGYAHKKGEGWNSCTTSRINSLISLMAYYLDKVFPVYDAWIKQYFDVAVTGSSVYDSAWGEGYGLYFSWTNPSDKNNVEVRSFQPKPSTTQITAFEFTPYMAQVAQGSTPLNIQSALESFQTILAVVHTVGGTTNPTNGTPTGGSPIYNEQNPQIQKAGLGGIWAWVLVAAGLGLAFNKMKPEPIKKTPATKNATKVATKVATNKTKTNKAKK